MGLLRSNTSLPRGACDAWGRWAPWPTTAAWPEGPEPAAQPLQPSDGVPTAPMGNDSCKNRQCLQVKLLWRGQGFFSQQQPSCVTGNLLVPGERVSSLPCFSRFGFSAFISSSHLEAWLLESPGSSALLCSASARWSQVPILCTPLWGFGEWEMRMQSILWHPLWSRLRGSFSASWEVGPGSTRSCGDQVQAQIEAGWLTG